MLILLCVKSLAMRQSLSATSDEASVRTGRGHRLAAVLIGAAVATSAIGLATTVVDQTGSQGLYGFTDAAYAHHGVTPDPALVYGILYVVAITITLIWALMLVLLKARGRWPSALSAVATLVTCTVAILLLTASEYGEQVFSPVWGALALIPTILGIAATIQLVRDARR